MFNGEKLSLDKPADPGGALLKMAIKFAVWACYQAAAGPGGGGSQLDLARMWTLHTTEGPGKGHNGRGYKLFCKNII